MDPAIAAAAAAGRTWELPPMLPEKDESAAATTASGGEGVGGAGQSTYSSSTMQAAAAAPLPYGYPITSYNATEILQRAAIETAALEGKPPPPPPGRFTFMNNATGPRVGPGLMSKRIATPPAWLHDFKEQHKVWMKSFAVL